MRSCPSVNAKVAKMVKSTLQALVSITVTCAPHAAQHVGDFYKHAIPQLRLDCSVVNLID
jgi:hypothetical protein